MMTIDQLVSMWATQKDNKIYINDDFFVYENQLEHLIYDENFDCIWNSKKGNIYFFKRTSYDEHLGKLFKFAYMNGAKLIRENGRWMVIPGHQMMAYHDVDNWERYLQDVYIAYKNRLVTLQENYIEKVRLINDTLKDANHQDSRIKVTNLKTYLGYLMEINGIIHDLTHIYYSCSVSRNKKNCIPFFKLAIKAFDKLNEEFLAIDLEPNRDELFYIQLSLDNLYIDDYKF